MTKTINVLFVEKVEANLTQMIQLLSNSFKVEAKAVETEIEIEAALLEKKWDAVVCNYVIPTISAIEVIGIVKRKDKTIPVIVVTDIPIDPIAVELIQAGAAEIIPRHSLTRLSVVIERELFKKTTNSRDNIFNNNLNLLQSTPTTLKTTVLGTLHFGLLVLAIIVILFGIYVVKNNYNVVDLYASNNGTLIAKSFVAGLENAKKSDKQIGTLMWLNDYCEKVKENTGNTILIADNQGLILAGIEKQDGIFIEDRTYFADKIFTNRIEQSHNIKKNKNSFFYIYYPFEFAQKQLWVVLDYTAERNSFLRYQSIIFYIVFIVITIVIITILLLGMLTNKTIKDPLTELQLMTMKINSKDLNTSFKTKRTDEIGMLIRAMETMRLDFCRSIISLEEESQRKKISDKMLHTMNLKMSRWVSELDGKTKEVNILNEMTKQISLAVTQPEFFSLVQKYMKQLFSSESGSIYIISEDGKMFDEVLNWGEIYASDNLDSNTCWALRTGRQYNIGVNTESNLICKHLIVDKIIASSINATCIPMISSTGVIGIFSLRSKANYFVKLNMPTERRKFDRQQIVVAVAENITLAYSNLKSRLELEKKSIIDSLTGLYNRRYMFETLDKEIHIATKQDSSIGIIMLDIDNFKLFNDKYGHAYGDTILQSLGNMVNSLIRKEDTACRYGGEEFLIILPRMNRNETKKFAEILLRSTREQKIVFNDNKINNEHILTISIGFSIFPGNGFNSLEILNSTDAALYEAKKAGKNCIIENISSENLGII